MADGVCLYHATRIGLSPADEYTLLIMAIPVGDYYKGGMKPVTALILDDYDRAAPLGVGHVKVNRSKVPYHNNCHHHLHHHHYYYYYYYTYFCSITQMSLHLCHYR